MKHDEMIDAMIAMLEQHRNDDRQTLLSTLTTCTVAMADMAGCSVDALVDTVRAAATAYATGQVAVPPEADVISREDIDHMFRVEARR